MLKAKNSGRQGLNIIIVGCGKVGSTLIEQLSKEGHDITIIDKNAQKVQEIANLYDIMGVVGNGASFSVQMEGGIENARSDHRCYEFRRIESALLYNCKTGC